MRSMVMQVLRISIMYITCLDVEGVLVPEIWIAFAEASGIPELKKTTRDEPDYDKLMNWRLGILKEHGLGLKEIQDVITKIDPLPGAKEFLDELRSFSQVILIKILYGENSMDERELSYEITVFTNPLMMIDALKTKRFDLAFLDLLMNEESGFGVAQEIRRMRLNTEIAIVTSYGEARNDAFQYRPIGYVDKPATIEEVTRLLRLYIDFYSDCKRYIYVGRASEERRIAVNDVTYIEVRGRSIKIEMSIEGRKNEINTTGTISEYEEKLKSSGFVRCYRSILVNPHHIKAYNVVSKEFSMSTGTRLPVSRSYAVQAVTAYNRAKNGDGRL